MHLLVQFLQISNELNKVISPFFFTEEQKDPEKTVHIIMISKPTITVKPTLKQRVTFFFWPTMAFKEK